jgi:hypothetical protein
MIDINELPSTIGDYLEYDETSSTFLRWKKKTCKKINVGEEAGSLKKEGYYNIMFNGKKYLNHRIIYFLIHSYCPECLDHIDNNRQNNNISNIREASRSQNNQNAQIRKDNTTGIKGLYTYKEKYWKLQIYKDRKVAFLKYYKLTDKTKDECRIILENKRKEIHGQFSNNGSNNLNK